MKQAGRVMLAAILSAVLTAPFTGAASAGPGWPCGWVYSWNDEYGEGFYMPFHGWDPGSGNVIYTHMNYTTHDTMTGYLMSHPGHTWCGS